MSLIDREKLDEYFISKGAEKDENVFVIHGSYKKEPWYLNPVIR